MPIVILENGYKGYTSGQPKPGDFTSVTFKDEDGTPIAMKGFIKEILI
jgi:hypothetical protein